MGSLFDQTEQKNRSRFEPLASRMRPRSLAEFVGQQQFLGEGKLLRRLIASQRIGSLIFYGPPGTGKTSLARLIAQHFQADFTPLNAASCGVKEVRTALQQADDRLATSGKRTILFVDELHHFTKTQQDVLLPELERGIVTFMGATTDNPFFALVAPLLSRSHIFEFEPLSADVLEQLIDRALQDCERGLGQLQLTITPKAREFLARNADGDARRALGAVEVAALSLPQSVENREITLEIAVESLQKKAIRYDRHGDEHYDAASALIKSIRGSDPHAAIYWMARMIEAGEPARFIARRLMIAAAEDIGNADPQGLLLATAAAQATEMVGMPECRIILAQVVTYLATAPKSNASYLAVDAALEDVRTQSVLPVPRHLKDRHYRGAQQLGHGDGYLYPHASQQGWVEQDYLGINKEYYFPVPRGFEQEIQQRMANQNRPSNSSAE